MTYTSCSSVINRIKYSGQLFISFIKITLTCERTCISSRITLISERTNTWSRKEAFIEWRASVMLDYFLEVS